MAPPTTETALERGNETFNRAVCELSNLIVKRIKNKTPIQAFGPAFYNDEELKEEAVEATNLLYKERPMGGTHPIVADFEGCSDEQKYYNMFCVGNPINARIIVKSIEALKSKSTRTIEDYATGMNYYGIDVSKP